MFILEATSSIAGITLQDIIDIAGNLTVTSGLAIGLYLFFSGKIMGPKSIQIIKDGYDAVIGNLRDTISMLTQKSEQQTEIIDSQAETIKDLTETTTQLTYKLMDAIPEVQKRQKGGGRNVQP